MHTLRRESIQEIDSDRLNKVKERSRNRVPCAFQCISCTWLVDDNGPRLSGNRKTDAGKVTGVHTSMRSDESHSQGMIRESARVEVRLYEAVALVCKTN